MNEEVLAAETLKRAARLMRERAEAATPGPWVGVSETTCTAFYWDREPEPQYGTRIMAGTSTHWLTGARLSDEKRAKADAEHVSAWSPPVALAVAAWLDLIVRTHEADGTGEDWWTNCPCDDVKHALDVALVYLGESAPASASEAAS